MIAFQSLRYKNLLATGNAWTEIKLNQHSMVLIIGKNGAGKSTLIDALCYVLFNRSFRFRSTNIASLVNSINNVEMCVELEFRVGTKHYKIIRGLRPQVFEIYENGRLLPQIDNRDQQKFLESSILGFNIKSFTQMVVVGSNSFTPFMRLGPQDRRAIIENVLDIEIFSTMNRVLKVKLKALNDLVDVLRNQAATNIEKIELQKKYIDDSKKSNEDLIIRKQSDLSNNEILITQLSDNANLVQKHVTVLQHQILDEKKIKNTIHTLESYRIQINSNVNKLKQEIQFFQNNAECPRCHQDIANKDTMIHECQAKVGELSTGLTELELKQSKVEARLTQITEIHGQINSHQMELMRLQSTINEKQRQVKQLLNEIQELAGKKPISDDILQVSKELYSELERINEQRKESSDHKSYFDAAAMLLKDSGIKAKIIKQYLPVINKMINKYLAAMDFFVNFNIDEEFKETIKSRHRDKFSYDNFSEGQKRRIDLSLLFTWRAVAKIKNSVDTNLLILDEVLDGSLDSDGVEEFMRLLHTFGTENNVFLISHRGDILADKFNHTLRFELVNNFSDMTES